MTTAVNDTVMLERLSAVLDTFGADETRWPAHEAAELRALLARSQPARAKLAEAKALDALLDTAPAFSEARLGALADSIMLAVEREPARAPMQAAAPKVIPLRKPPVRAARPVFTPWAGAALAASLVLGVLAGQSSTVAPAALAMLGQETSAPGASSQVALGDEVDGLLDEDLL